MCFAEANMPKPLSNFLCALAPVLFCALTSLAQIAQLQAKAEAGDEAAEFALAKAYDEGKDVTQSDEKAAKWYRAAAEKGNAAAQNDIGLMLMSGRGVDKNKEEAVTWYRKAAQQKNPSAMFNLGTAYYNGDGVDINDVAAYSWFLLAQDFGSTPAVDAVKRMDDEKGNLRAEALETVGNMYQAGAGLPRSSDDAALWYRKAADLGSPSSQMKLVGILLEGPNAAAHYADALQLCQKAASLNYAPGAYCVGRFYQQGLSVDKDPVKAAKSFEEAAKLGDAPAMLRLADIYWKGDGVKQDKTVAYEYILLASSGNVAEARQEKDSFEKQMTTKEIEKGKAKAIQWTRQRSSLVLMKRTPSAN